MRRRLRRPPPPTTPAAAARTAVAAATTTPDAGPNDAFSLEAVDGNATLEIPAGALPPGVTPNDISITQIEGPSEERFAVYRLEPDGMVPLEPLILTVTVDLAEGEGVSVAVVDADGNPVDGAAEIVGFARATDDGPLDLLVRVHHFSGWIIGKVDEHFRVDIEPVDDQAVGTTFTVHARVVRDPQMLITYTSRDGVLWVGTNEDVDGSWLGGRWRASGPISPNEAYNPGPGGSERYAAEQDEVVVEQQFPCDANGDFAISFRVGAGLYMELRQQGSASSTMSHSTFGHLPRVSWSAKCVMPKIVASAAPPFTTYTLSPEIPSATSFAWSGANCGSVTGSTTSTMVWNHGEEGCEHAGEAHPDAQISVLVSGTFPVSGESFELRCTYVSAASGEGPECTVAD